jgi:hypothetical protein
MTRRAFIAAALPALQARADSWLILDLPRGGERSCFSNDHPICFGSLLKPFLAIAFSATHRHFPVIRCAGTRSGCWNAQGHGEEDIIAALANSCNTYFLALARAMDPAALDQTALSFGLALPERTLAPENLIGLARGWPQSPSAVAHAFALLPARAAEPGVGIALRGLARCARLGTARACGFPCYAKPGTAPCSHLPRAAGDGFALAIYPPQEPRRVLLAASHGTTGAMAAHRLKSLAASLR